MHVIKTLSAQIWDVLSNVECGEAVEKKGEFNYLSWAKGWRMLMQAGFTDVDYNFELTHNPDQTAQVKCTFTIHVGHESVTHHETLPVLNWSNKPIVNPNSMDINTARQRVLVKTLARFGLGIDVYAGEDLNASASGSDAVGKVEYVDADWVSNVNKFLKSKKIDVEEVNKMLMSVYQIPSIDKVPVAQKDVVGDSIKERGQ